MGFFGFGSKKDKREISRLQKENASLLKENRRLTDLCEEKDSFLWS